MLILVAIVGFLIAVGESLDFYDVLCGLMCMLGFNLWDYVSVFHIWTGIFYFVDSCYTRLVVGIWFLGFYLYWEVGSLLVMEIVHFLIVSC